MRVYEAAVTPRAAGLSMRTYAALAFPLRVCSKIHRTHLASSSLMIISPSFAL